MKDTLLRNLMDTLRKSLLQEDAIRLIVLLDAWKTLSREKKITSSSLTFTTFYNSEITVERFKETLEQLSLDHKIFDLFLPFGHARNKIDDTTLATLFNEVSSSEPLTDIGLLLNTFDVRHRQAIALQVSELGIKLLGDSCDEIYAPFNMDMSFTYFTDKPVYAESLGDEFLVEAMKIIDHLPVQYKHTDPLDKPMFINSHAKHQLRKFKCTLSFPPFNMRGANNYYTNDIYNRFKVFNGKGSQDVAHLEHILAQTEGKAIVLMPVGFNYRASTEFAMRKHLVNSNLIEAVLQLPPHLHPHTSIETTLLVLNFHKEDKNVQFINLNQDHFVQKGKRQITFKDLDEIISIYTQKESIEDISTVVSNDEIASNNYVFSIDRYVVSKEAQALEQALASYEVMPLDDIADIRRSQMFKDEETGLEVIELSPGELANAGYTVNSSRHKQIGSQESKLQTYVLQKNDIILGTKGTIGKVAIIGDSSTPLIASQAMQVIRPTNTQVDPIVLYMYLKSDIGQALLKQLVAGVAMPQIATSEIKKFKVPVLSLSEQEHIMHQFQKEIELYETIEEQKNVIKKIHSNFLGEN